MKLSLLSFAFLLYLTANAQLHSDCGTAIEICANEILTITTSGDHGVTEELGPPCVDEDLSLLEFGSNWFTFSFVTDGEFYFTITPEQYERDIDFVLFQTNNGSCNSKFPIRCMAAGENVGDPLDSMCLGPTGLSPESQDFFEDYGCAFNSDNFLAAVDVQSGDSYILAVIDFTINEDDSFHYDIEFFSTATYECAPVSVKKDPAESEEVLVFPNPISESFEVEIEGISNQDYPIQVNDVNGFLLYSGTIKAGEKQTIDTKHWSSGIYYLRTINSRQAKIKTLVKI